MKMKTLASVVLSALGVNTSADLLEDGSAPGMPSDLLVAIYDASTAGSNAGKTDLLNTKLSYGDILTGKV